MFKIFIGNVNFKTTEEQLKEVFEPHIVVEDMVIARDPRTGRSKGYGFAMTRDTEKGRQAIDKIGKVRIDGRLVYLKEAHGKRKQPKKPPRPRRRQHPRPDRGSGGFRSGPSGHRGYTGLEDEMRRSGPDAPRQGD